MTTMLKMHLHFLSLILLFCVSPSSFVTAYYFKTPVVGLVDCRPNQIQALTKFKNEFDTSHCNHSDPYNGVWCDNSTSAITKLRLRACLRGTLKPNSSLFALHHLRHLQLSHNNFSTSLPSEFGNLNRLEFLSLSNNGFVGQVPSSFNNLSQLSVLSLSQNELTGSFPLVRNLTTLLVLNLSHNHFSGTLNPNSSLFELHQLAYLNLGYNNFSSSLPSEFGNLNRLESLSLPSNDFFGQFPPTTTMPFLSHLNLRGNSFTGSIVFLNSSSSSKLETMLLGDNYFEGKIIEPISKLINLKRLDLSFLNTSYYPLDVSLLSSLKSLLLLDLSGSSISPASLGSNSDIPPNLEILALSGCGISEFPNILKILQKLKILYLSNNRITGKVPEWLWKIPRLSAVLLKNNSLNGFQGPAEVMVNSSVKYLDLRLNCFEGAIPILPLSLDVFVARGNRFTGSIPLSICSCSSLTILSLTYNNLTGPIPHCLSNVAFLTLRRNNLEGSIPDEFYAGVSLQSLDVGYNRLTGKLPRSLVNCSSLQFISVENNKIQDTFPFWLKSLPNLQVLNLRSNNFFGPISPSDQGSLGFPKLWILDISDNKFSGSLPPSYFENWKASSLLLNEDGNIYMTYEKKTISGMLSYDFRDTMDLRYKGLSVEQQRIFTSYAAIDFSGNRLEGQIPESIGLLKALIALNLSNNAFTGHIPLSFSNLSNLESFDLSSNQLSGTIPNGLKSLSFLAYINMSHNQLKGEIPQGTQITGQPKSSFEGNKGLCGLPLQETCFDTHAPPTQHPEDEGEEEEEEVLNWKAVTIGCGPGVLLGLAIGQVIASYNPEWFVKILVRISA